MVNRCSRASKGEKRGLGRIPGKRSANYTRTDKYLVLFLHTSSDDIGEFTLEQWFSSYDKCSS